MITYCEFEERLEGLRRRIEQACQEAGRAPSDVRILPVTKNHPVEAVHYAERAGLAAVGENRVQEVAEKRQRYDGPIRWELIGHLQSNKVSAAVALFDRIQSVDSLKLLHRLDRLAGEAGRELPILLQCNSGEDPDKFGFPVEAAPRVLEAALQAPHLRVEGLMTIAPLDDDPDAARRAFERLRKLRDALAEQFGVALAELSMGMTGDLEAAIAAGSTQIRVGTALYGSRA